MSTLTGKTNIGEAGSAFPARSPAALGIWLWSRRRGLNAARWLDIFAPALLLGQAIGRLGNFVNQELYGPPTILPWGIPIDGAHRIAPWDDLAAYPVDTTRFHPLDLSHGELDHPRCPDRRMGWHHRLRAGRGVANHPPPPWLGRASHPSA